MILPLTSKNDPILHRKTVPVRQVTDSIRTLITDMFTTMEHHKGIGLAAPQIGVPLAIFVIDVNGNRFSGVNPEIVKTDGAAEGVEGCLSYLGFGHTLNRAHTVVVKYRNAQGVKKRIRVSGMIARVFQHEIDHLSGITILDRVESKPRVDQSVQEEESSELARVATPA
jgi:peptide deformylase